MKALKQMNLDFESHDMDSILTRWLLEGVKKKKNKTSKKLYFLIDAFANISANG